MGVTLLKGAGPSRRNSDGNPPVLEQWIKVSRGADALPQTATETIFNVLNGRVLLKALIGEVTTAIQNQANNLSINVDADSGASDVLASTVDSANQAVGTLLYVEGDGTALVLNPSWGQACVGNGVILNPGLVTLTASASNTGAVKWDFYYFPLDPNAYVTATAP